MLVDKDYYSLPDPATQIVFINHPSYLQKKMSKSKNGSSNQEPSLDKEQDRVYFTKNHFEESVGSSSSCSMENVIKENANNGSLLNFGSFNSENSIYSFLESQGSSAKEDKKGPIRRRLRLRKAPRKPVVTSTRKKKSSERPFTPSLFKRMNDEKSHREKDKDLEKMEAILGCNYLEIESSDEERMERRQNKVVVTRRTESRTKHYLEKRSRNLSRFRICVSSDKSKMRRGLEKRMKLRNRRLSAKTLKKEGRRRSTGLRINPFEQKIKRKISAITNYQHRDEPDDMCFSSVSSQNINVPNEKKK